MEVRLRPLFYWRLLLVGWGTGVAACIIRFVVLGDWHFGPRPFFKLAYFGTYAALYGTYFSVFALIPMIGIWFPIFIFVRKQLASVRRATSLAAALSAMVAMLLLGLILSLLGRIGNDSQWVLLPWTPVVMAIAACLTWFAFRSEQFAGGK